MDALITDLDISEDEYVCGRCHLVHWRGTPLRIACEALAD